jgi:hypothetical protein
LNDASRICDQIKALLQAPIIAPCPIQRRDHISAAIRSFVDSPFAGEPKGTENLQVPH